MARKKEEEAEVESVAEPKLKPIQIFLPEEEHRQLRILASFAGVSMVACLRNVCSDWIKEEAARRGLGK